MTENPTQSERNPDPINMQQSGFARLAEWKTQLAALAAAPLFGIGYAFDFLLRAKDFPELASAMWGVIVLLVGIFLFFFFLTCAALLDTILGSSERDIQSTGWQKALEKWLPRSLFAVGIVFLLLTGYFTLLRSGHGFGHFVTPYVQWLNEHSR